MCLILFADRVHSRYRLVLGANRDEFHARPTAALQEWEDAPGVYGGRDLQAGGTWLGVTAAGRWAAVTNFRNLAELGTSGKRSRGELVAGFLTGNDTRDEYLQKLLPQLGEFAGFNLLLGDEGGASWLSNRADTPAAMRLTPDVYGVSNHLLDTPWPKVTRGKKALAELVGREDLASADLLDLLIDRTLAADAELPETGVGLEMERLLSAAFIRSSGYGTRCSTALLIGVDGTILIQERRFGPTGEAVGETLLRI